MLLHLLQLLFSIILKDFFLIWCTHYILRCITFHSTKSVIYICEKIWKDYIDLIFIARNNLNFMLYLYPVVRAIIYTWMRPCAHDSYSTSQRIDPLYWKGISRKLRSIEDREGSRLLSSVLPRSLVYRNQFVGVDATRINSFRSVNARARVASSSLYRSHKRFQERASRRHYYWDFLCSRNDDTAPTSFTSDLYIFKCDHYSFDREFYVRHRV